jgi:hypothetical protein
MIRHLGETEWDGSLSSAYVCVYVYELLDEAVRISNCTPLEDRVTGE